LRTYKKDHFRTDDIQRLFFYIVTTPLRLTKL